MAGDPLEFKILGPVEVAAGPERLELGGTRQQIVLAALLLGAGSLVTMGRLVEAVYGQDVPPTARSQVQSSVSSLRRLFAAHGRDAVISTRTQGYVLQLGGDRLDSARFAELAAMARAARDAGRAEEAVASYRDALRLWRGRALEGLDSQLLQAAASRLDEQRSAVTEDRIALELDLGRQHELVGELTELVVEFPLRERLRAQLMLALYRCGRVAEALAAYRQGWRTMVDELGIEPGEELQQLEQAILTSDPALAPPGQAPPPKAGPAGTQSARRQVPRLLPAGIADFTGRETEAGQIRRHLAGAAGGTARVAAPIVVITGKGGMGKTSLVVHAAHGLAGRFPHGQLFADLHGGGPDPVSPARALERFLRALGVPGPQIPETLDERAEMYRNLLAGRRILIVLDDAVAESQVWPLLPGSGHAAVLVTSRGRLTGLAGALHVELEVFDPGSSVALLAGIAGAGRVRAQPAAAAAVAGYCGHLPLALRIAGARLAARPQWDIGQLAGRLADQTRRLDELRHGDLGVRASISLSYDAATGKAQRLLRRLALLEAPVFSGWVAAPLLDQPPDEATDLLDDLADARLTDPAGRGTGQHGQYRLHELIRVFARERLAAQETAAEQTAALQRALGALLHLTEQARRCYHAGALLAIDDDARWPLPAELTQQLISDPLAWFERERPALVSGVRQAARAGLTGLCWSLALSAEDFFVSRAYHDDWRQAVDIALHAAREARDVQGQAAMLDSRGSLRIEKHRYGQARRDLDAAARLFRDGGDELGCAVVADRLAYIDRLSGRPDDAATRLERALAVFRRVGDHVAAAGVLISLAQLKLDLREPGAATKLLAEALRLARAGQSRRAEAQVLHRMGQASLLSGELTQAVGTFGQALNLVRDMGDPVGEAWVLGDLGIAKVRLGEFGQARGALRRALELAATVSGRLAEMRALLGLTELALASGNPEQAVELGRQVTAAFQAMQAPLYEAQALSLLCEAHAARGDSPAAETAAARAAALRARAAGKAQVRGRH